MAAGRCENLELEFKRSLAKSLHLWVKMAFWRAWCGTLMISVHELNGLFMKSAHFTEG
jgi:hypothetical protein